LVCSVVVALVGVALEIKIRIKASKQGKFKFKIKIKMKAKPILSFSQGHLFIIIFCFACSSGLLSPRIWFWF
jgi:hypothetical protein